MQLAIAGGFALGPAIGGGLQQVHTLNVQVVVPVYMNILCTIECVCKGSVYTIRFYNVDLT